MAYSGWLALAGTELLNNQRVTAYAHHLGLPMSQCGCDGLPYAIGDTPYTTPQADGAPWYDPAVPESTRLAGFMGLEIDGMMRGTGRRNPVPLFSDGSVPGALRLAQRELTVRAVMMAQDECAASYGIGWLAGALKGGICTPGCLGDELCAFTCCPPCGPGDPTCGSSYVRRMYAVGLLDGPEVTSWRQTGPGHCGPGLGPGIIAGLSFVLVAGRPWLHREPVAVVTDAPSKTGYSRPASAGVPNCSLVGNCLADPLCPPAVLPPLPPLPVDPCACGPVDQTGTVISVPAGLVPEVFEKVPLMSVFAGSKAMRCLTIRFYANPINRPCLDVVQDPCAACTEINISYIPPYTTFTIDGRTQRATVDCVGVGGLQDATASLVGQAGGPFEWPTFDCASWMCVEVLAKATDHADDAKVSLSFVVREDAA